MAKTEDKRAHKKFTRAVKDFILDKMSEGYDIAQICRKWPDEVPARKSIYNKAVQDKEFGEEINQAYTVLLIHRMDELHEIATQTASEAYPGLDWREAEATLKRRIDEAKFVLGKMAPILSKKFDKAQKVEVSGEALGPQIQVINYHKPNSQLEKLANAQQVVDSLDDKSE